MWGGVFLNVLADIDDREEEKELEKEEKELEKEEIDDQEERDWDYIERPFVDPDDYLDPFQERGVNRE